jgi:hypothetical protein
MNGNGINDVQQIGLSSGGLITDNNGYMELRPSSYFGASELGVAADLGLKGNELKDVGGIQGCGPNQYLTGDGDCRSDQSSGGASINSLSVDSSSQDDQITLDTGSGSYTATIDDDSGSGGGADGYIGNSGGHTAGGDLDMQNNNIDGLYGLSLEGPSGNGGGAIEHRYGGIKVSANSNRFFGPGIMLASDTEVTGELIVRGSELDMSGNKLSNVGGIQGCGPDQYLAGDGDCEQAAGPADTGRNSWGRGDFSTGGGPLPTKTRTCPDGWVMTGIRYQDASSGDNIKDVRCSELQ